jgi:hypothetical protein
MVPFTENYSRLMSIILCRDGKVRQRQQHSEITINYDVSFEYTL